MAAVGKDIETNSLQLVKRLAGTGNHVAFTSEPDAAPELISGALVFIPVRDKGADPQTVSVAIDARKPFSKIARIVADGLAAGMDADLHQVRRQASRLSDAGAGAADGCVRWYY